MSREKKSVCVVVVGDVGRSPRMQYHALSLAKEGFDVDIVGYGGSEPIPELRERHDVHFIYMSPCPDIRSAMFLPFKVLWQFCTLLAALFWKKKSDFVLLQNPPAVPAMIVCWFYCFCVNSNFVVDWHNYGFSIMSLSLGEQHILVRFYKWIEFYFGRKATAHLCVTKAMREDLEKHWKISATTLYDRPPDIFRPISVKEEHELFLRLGVDFEDFRSGLEVTRFTRASSDGQYELRDDRPGLLVSSTSWTEDEDFGLLLYALQKYETTRATGQSGLPPLVCVITGKGPMKHYYCNLIASKKWRHVQVITPWLQPQDYPSLLASADLGVCLHTSSSGLDLPMKVVDMFGCCLPVCAIKFKCLDELVRHDQNSLVFHDAEELSEQLISWFHKFPVPNPKVSLFRAELQQFRAVRWHDNWVFNALPVFNK
ncbi:Chitobiosyldiphosphodolichol beta-mannosyltransferase [Frankliniella fusca]|uniref:Chitobiosyldiphosphodolichol beta-mannosyltransferase n=1 Tax=Frankliniella fusca TaxID=407009 RepID=A0AAE1HHR8_9NEOP|nr:Chitobiosyldiphosphodolichol beta-mannosyltransferase [Frankliniella fusca]